MSIDLGYAALGSIEDREQGEFPSNKSSSSYNLNVCEIQNRGVPRSLNRAE